MEEEGKKMQDSEGLSGTNTADNINRPKRGGRGRQGVPMTEGQKQKLREAHAKGMSTKKAGKLQAK